MSFHSDLIAAWPADLASVVGALLTSAAQVTVGLQPARVPNTSGAAWIEYRGREGVGSGLQPVWRHSYLVHLYAATTNRGPDGAGGQQLSEVATAADEIADAYHGGSRMRASLAGLVATEAEALAPFVDPDSPQRAEGQVAFVFTEAA